MARLAACLVSLTLGACAPDQPAPSADGSTAAPPDAAARTVLRLAHDPALAEAAQGLEHRYELDRPEIDVVLVERAPADATLLADAERRGQRPAALIERRIGIVVPLESRLRLIDLSRGTCDIIIGRAGTPLGEMGRETLAARGLDDQINPRLLAADADDLIDWVVERDAIGLDFAARAAERDDQVRVIADGVRRLGAVVADTPEGERLLDWLTSGVTTRRPLRMEGWDVVTDALRITPQDQP